MHPLHVEILIKSSLPYLFICHYNVCGKKYMTSFLHSLASLKSRWEVLCSQAETLLRRLLMDGTSSKLPTLRRIRQEP